MNESFRTPKLTFPSKKISFSIVLHVPLLQHRNIPNDPVVAILGVFDSDPGLQNEDWIHISNYQIGGERLDFKAKVTGRLGHLTRKGNVDESILDVRILVEAEDKRITEKIAEVFKDIEPDLY
jgi:hypothetical protein